MGYKSETIQSILSRINSSYFLPAMQRDFVWNEEQICELFDSLMRGYPISSFLFWHVPAEARPDLEAYGFLREVRATGNRVKRFDLDRNRDVTFVLDGQQRLTSLWVGLSGKYYAKKAKAGKGAKLFVEKKLYLDLLHDGRVRDETTGGDVEYKFKFSDYIGMSKNTFWFEVGQILQVGSKENIEPFIKKQIQKIRELTGLNSSQESLVVHNLMRLYSAVCVDEVISYYTVIDSDHEKILEIFVRANSGGTKLSKSDLLLSTLTLHWSDAKTNAKEVIKDFVDDLNKNLTKKNDFDKDFVMKTCLVLLDEQIAYKVSSFTKETCNRIERHWDKISDAIRRAVDAANAFGVDENTFTSHNAIIPVAYYLNQHRNLTLRGESAVEESNANRVRIWLLTALLNGVLGGSSDLMLTRLRAALGLDGGYRANGDFPLVELDKVVKELGRTAVSSENSINNVLEITYDDRECFLALSLLYDEKNWGTMTYSIDHLFPQSAFKNQNLKKKDEKELFNCLENLALVISSENSGKKDRPLHEWLESRGPSYLKRHLIPTDPSLWRIENYADFRIERRKLLKARIERVFSLVTTA